MAIELNTIYNEDCLETMKRMPDNFVDLVVTSPPYDNLRTYNGSLVWSEMIWKNILTELFRVTKEGGVVVWVVGDATIKGSETGTSSKQALWAIECGFNLHDTMIWHKLAKFPHHENSKRYKQQFEYMFVLSKGFVKTYNPIYDVPNKSAGKNFTIKTKKKSHDNDVPNGKTKNIKIAKYRMRDNVWAISQTGLDGHPAPFPEQLAHDHIISWSNEGDIVYDPFMGSGTTAVASKELNRNYIGSEISKEYCDIAEKRLAQEVLL